MSKMEAVVWALFTFTGVGLLWIAVHGCGSGAGAASCAVVDVAKYACDHTPIRYLGPDGKEHTEQVPTEELTALAQKARLHRLQRVDGGTDGN